MQTATYVMVSFNFFVAVGGSPLMQKNLLPLIISTVP